MTPDNEHWKLFDGTTASPWEVCTNKSGNCTIRQVGSSGYLSPWIASERDAALICAAVNALPELLARLERYETALTTIGHSLVCAPTDYAEHNASELLKAGNIARAALNQETGHD